MTTLVYSVFGAAEQAQRALSFSVLSALKQGLGDCRILLLCDAANRREDLPVEHLVRPELPGVFDRLDLLSAQLGAPFCLVDPESDFTAPPARLFARLADTPDGVMVHSRAGWLSARPHLEAWAAEMDPAPDGSTELFDLRILALDPQKCSFQNRTILDKFYGSILNKNDSFQQFLVNMQISTQSSPGFAADLVTLYSDRPLRHVYHGMQRAMFPAGLPVDCARAQALPAVKAPPQPLTLQWKAKLTALRRGYGVATTEAYLAYLCAIAAPTPQGRDVWANMALDHLATSQQSPADLQRALPRLAPSALGEADLRDETRARWQAFWSSLDSGPK